MYLSLAIAEFRIFHILALCSTLSLFLQVLPVLLLVFLIGFGCLSVLIFDA